MTIVTTETPVFVAIYCPWRHHNLRFSLPRGVRFRAICHTCGREFEQTA